MAFRNKEIAKEYHKNYYIKNREKILKQNKNYWIKNREKYKEQAKKWYIKNSKVIKENQKFYYFICSKKILEKNRLRWKKNKEKYNLIHKKWTLKNKDYMRNYWNEYSKKRKKDDINYHLIHILRNRLSKFIKNKSVNYSFIKLLGCSIDELKIHLEKQFKEGMNWGNYGFRGWHIDHVYPLSKANLTNENELKKVCHYTNLQPLWWKDNIVKGNKI